MTFTGSSSFRISSIILVFLLSSLFNDHAAQNQKTGTVSGKICEKETGSPLEFATVIVRSVTDTTIVRGAITNKNGKFRIENVAPGEYKIQVSFIGYESGVTAPFKLTSPGQNYEAGTLTVSSSTNSLNEVVVKSERSTYVNTIDRKTFNVGKDIAGKTGSVSDLMQNIPSVTVDIDGVVSLRGSSNVMILINGKPSALMGANRAAVLQQMPANSIEKIEVITNPSAKYKPDGTAGIINIVLKKDKTLGLNGTVSANAGNEDRYNANFLASYNPGKLNISGSYSIRQDDRLRITNDSRIKTDTSRTSTYSTINTTDHSRPLSQIIRTGLDYKINDNNSVGVNGSFNYRNFDRYQANVNNSFDSSMVLTKDYDRINNGSQTEQDVEFGANVSHTFSKASLRVLKWCLPLTLTIF
jgi:hypothetical protein